MTIVALTREALEAYLASAPRQRFLATGAGHSGRTDIAERMEELLLGEDVDRNSR
jgi:hypothetical protein